MVMRTDNRLHVLRAERRLSQMRLAEKAGISHNRYWRIENGHAVPTDDEIASLARALAIEPSDVWSVPAAS